MKKLFLSTLLLSAAFLKLVQAQGDFQADNAYFKIGYEEQQALKGRWMIAKFDSKTNKQLFNADAHVHDKSRDEAFQLGDNRCSFQLAGGHIAIIYDVWQKSTKTKDCLVKFMDLQNGQLSEPKILYSAKVNSMMSQNQIIFRPVYSPDLTKVAVLMNNVGTGYDIAPGLTIYDTKTFEVLSAKQISDSYDNKHATIDGDKMKLDNDGNIALILHVADGKSKTVTHDYSANIPFKSAMMENVKDLKADMAAGKVLDEDKYGYFFKDLQDYNDKKIIPGFRVKTENLNWNIATGNSLVLIDNDDKSKSYSMNELPSDLFTYMRDQYSAPYLIRVIDSKPYIVLSAGALCYYAYYNDQPRRYFSVGWNGELQRFDDDSIDQYLKQYGLYDDYKSEKPKRQRGQDSNSYLNDVVAWQAKYFEVLNKLMQKK